MAGHRKMKDPGNQQFAHDRIPDPKDIPDFRENFIQLASVFMGRHEISTFFQVSERELDAMSFKEFGQGCDEVIHWCQTVADAEDRKCMRMLAQCGNPTAMNIYSTSISHLQKQSESQASGIKVVGTLDVNLEHVDGENDGGVHLIPEKENEK